MQVAQAGSLWGRQILPTDNGLRIEQSGGTRLDLVEFSSDAILVRDEFLPRSIFGSLTFIIATEMDANGADTTNPVQVDTFYYVYVCGRNVLAFPGKLALSTVAPASADAVGYLGDLGTGGAYARCVGAVYLHDSGGNPTSKDDDEGRNVYNYFNQVRRRLLVTPAYVDANANTTVTINSAAFAAVNAGTSDSVSWISGDVPVHLAAGFKLDSAAPAVAGIQVGIGIDSATSCNAGGGFANAAAALTTAHVSLVDDVRTGGFPNWSRRRAHLVAYTNSANLILRSANVRNGSTIAPSSLYLTGDVLT